MADATTSVEIPNRAQFKAAEVCELVKVQPYVLRTWEAEFPELGVAKTEGGPRVYRRADVEQVLKIKHLLLVEGLTLAGARRKLQEPVAPVVTETAPAVSEPLGDQARERLTAVKRGLQSILELLAGQHQQAEFQLTAPANAMTTAAPAAPIVESKAKSRAAASGAASRRKR